MCYPNFPFHQANMYGARVSRGGEGRREEGVGAGTWCGERDGGVEGKKERGGGGEGVREGDGAGKGCVRTSV